MKDIQIARGVQIGFLVLLLLPQIAFAQWIPDGIPICTATSYQGPAVMAPDGLGGAIIVWHDWRNVAYSCDLYAQRVSSSGNVLWTVDGITICGAAQRQLNPRIIPRGTTGAIIAWQDMRSEPGYGDIYAQRVDMTGNVLWTTYGVPICTATGPFSEGAQINPVMVSDGSGGAIIAWQDGRGDPQGGADVYAQRVRQAGDVFWTTDGIPICNETGLQGPFCIVSDGSDGAIITFADTRTGDWDIYAQRVNSSGDILWTTSGVPICTRTHVQASAIAISDGSGGAIIAWADSGNAVDYDIYAQRVNASGSVLWKANGIPICSEINSQKAPNIASDGSGGAIITWEDPRGGTLDIYTQRIDGSGNTMWTANGIPICSAPYSQKATSIVSDGSNGAIITWEDGRSNDPVEPYDIFAQRVDGSGNILWAVDGLEICTKTYDQLTPSIISDSFTGGAIIAFHDGEVYAQRIYCEVEPDNLDFGTIATGETKDLTFTIKNRGGRTLSGSISELCSHYSIASGGGSYSLAYGQSRLVTVRFEPTSGGMHQCTVETGDPQCVDVSCAGVGFDCQSGTIYVDTDATGTGDGSSWEDAFIELHDALWTAEICNDVTEIWVAEGTYTPTAGIDRSATFTLRDGLGLYGGFAGIETSRSERNWMANVSVLSGDIGVMADSTDNSYHVVTGSGTDSTAVLDGFTVTNGRADGTGNDLYGGGMYISSGNPTIANVIFLRNSAAAWGGGMCNDSSSPALFNVTFSQNSALNGGGMYNSNYSDPILFNVTVSGNSAINDGGGIVNATQSSPELTNVVISGNSAGRYGGGMLNSWRNNTVLTNVIFSGNSSVSSGGGMYNTESSNGELINVTFAGNTALGLGGGIFNDDSDLTITNCIFWGDSAGVTTGYTSDEICATYLPIGVDRPFISYSLIEDCGVSGGGWDGILGINGGNNIDTDPQFKGDYYPDSPLAVWSSSPAIDAGDNTAVPSWVTTDIDGNPRIYNGLVDMGAYEYQGTATGINDEYLPKVISLRSPYPNPFNPVVTVEFDLDRRRNVLMMIYDVSGRLVRVLAEGVMEPGRKSFTWDGCDDTGLAVTSGVYFCRFIAGDFVQTRKMILLR